MGLVGSNPTLSAKLSWMHEMAHTPELEYILGQWHALNRVLNYLNTLDQKQIDKTDLYEAIMELRPEPRSSK